MTYSEQLHPWCIIRTLPDNNYVVVARFRRRGDAVAYLQVLQRSVNHFTFMVTFDAKNVKNSLDK